MSELALALPQPTPEHRRVAAMLSVAVQHPAALYVASLAAGSRQAMVDALRRAAKFFGGSVTGVEWHRLTFGHLTALRSHLVDHAAPSTANKILSAVRGVLRFCVKLETMTAEAMRKAVDVPTVRGSREPKGRSLTQAELRAMLELACERDRCILTLLCGGGLRRAEIAALDVEHYDGSAVLVHGKGNKERTVPLPLAACVAIETWLDVRGRQPGPLIVSGAGNKLTDRRLTHHGYYSVLDALALKSGIRHFSPHDLRRTYIGDLLDAGVDLATVQSLVGHTDPATTARYDRRGERARREAVAKLPMPV